MMPMDDRNNQTKKSKLTKLILEHYTHNIFCATNYPLIQEQQSKRQNDTMTVNWFGFFLENCVDLVNDSIGNKIEKCLR